jgi:hypothetical protein
MTACLLKNEPASKFQWLVKQGDLRSQSESESEQGAVYDKSLGFDPKPGELPMARVKSA